MKKVLALRLLKNRLRELDFFFRELQRLLKELGIMVLLTGAC
jgi:hypothetical protein